MQAELEPVESLIEVPRVKLRERGRAERTKLKRKGMEKKRLANSKGQSKDR